MDKVYLLPDLHIGDSLTFLNFVHTHNISTDSSSIIYGPNYIEELLEVFDYKDFSYGGNSSWEIKYTTNLNSLMSEKFKYADYIIHCFCEWITKKSISIEKIILPKTKIEKTQDENIALFQFDSRSICARKKRIGLNEIEQEKILLKFGKNLKTIGIGGLNTQPYLNKEFRLGNIKNIVQNLLNCKKFIGVDSGISHFAGIIGVESDIINININNDWSSEIIEVYNFMYPTLKNYKKNDIFKIKMI